MSQAYFRQLSCPGVGRDKDNEATLIFYFNRKPTDDEMRLLHDMMGSAVYSLPMPQQKDQSHEQ